MSARSSDSCKFPRLLTAFAALLVLAGCESSAGIDPQSSLRDPNSFDAGADIRAAAKRSAVDWPAQNWPAQNWPAQNWWTSYGDAQLDRLVAATIAENPSLKAAQARLRDAQALAQIAGAKELPSVEAEASIHRTHETANSFIPAPWAGSSMWNNASTLTLSYDLDLWGKEEDVMEATVDRGAMQAAEERKVQLDLETDLVQKYVELALQYTLRDVSRETLAQQQRILDLTQRQVAAGLGTELDLSQAQTPLPATRAQIEQTDEAIGIIRHQIAVLAGKGPGFGDTLARPSLRPGFAGAVPDALPAHLVGRRPDVVARRWQVEAASKDIEAAKADFYPDINLSVATSYAGTTFSQILSHKSVTHDYGPAISLPIFTGGRLRGQLGEKTAQYDAAVEGYNAAVLAALQEVADEVLRLQAVARERQETQQAMDVARRAFDLAQKSYRAGLSGYLTVLNAQTQLFAAEQRDARVRADGLGAYAGLMQALGGGLGDDLATPKAGAEKGSS